MSGHHPPPYHMPVPPYIPRQLPMAHSGPWHNSSSGMPPPPGPPPSTHPQQQAPLQGNAEHIQYPSYLGTNSRKAQHDQYGGRHHPMAGDFDSPMMDLSVNRHQGQFNNTSPRNNVGLLDAQAHLNYSQDFSNKYHNKDACDGPILSTPPAANHCTTSSSSSNNNGVGFPNEIDLLHRRQNPLGLPPMAEAMELVKEVLLSKIKSQVPSISDLGAAFTQDPEELVSKPEVEGDTNSVNAGAKESRRKTRKPNKTSKVVNEEEAPARSPTEPAGNVGDVTAPQEKAVDAEVNHSSNKRPATEEAADVSPATDDETKKRRRNRRSNDTSPTEESQEQEAVAVKGTPNGEPVNGDVKEEAPKEEKKTPADPETSFEDVENKLTEMFAGIAEEEAKPARKVTPGRRNSICHLSMLIGDQDLDSDDDEDFCLEAEEKKKAPKGKKKAPAKKKSSERANGGGAAAAGGGGGNKRKGGKGGAAAAKKKKKAASKWEDEELPPALKKQPKEVEEGRYRGPLLQVRQDGSLSVLNGPQGQTEDDAEGKASKAKFLHNGGAERNKVIRGLHTNTLSMKYDTDRTDTTWICVFCKLGPHKRGLGDLFGPYMVTTDCDEFRQMEANEGDLFKSNRSRLDMVQTAPHRLPAVPAGEAGAQVSGPAKTPNGKPTTPGKRGPKKKQPPVENLSVDTPPVTTGTAQSPGAEDLYVGLTRATDTSYEIWMHEDCIVWGSGIHMIAGRLVGVEDAVWSSTRSLCGVCRRAGAVVCCLQRGCNERVHLPCGRLANWTLDEEVLNSYCSLHGRQSEVAVCSPGEGTSMSGR